MLVFVPAAVGTHEKKGVYASLGLAIRIRKFLLLMSPCRDSSVPDSEVLHMHLIVACSLVCAWAGSFDRRDLEV